MVKYALFKRLYAVIQLIIRRRHDGTNRLLVAKRPDELLFAGTREYISSFSTDIAVVFYIRKVIIGAYNHINGFTIVNSVRRPTSRNGKGGRKRQGRSTTNCTKKKVPSGDGRSDHRSGVSAEYSTRGGLNADVAGYTSIRGVMIRTATARLGMRRKMQ